MSGTQLCSFSEQSRDSFVLERGLREENDDRLEALLQAEVAMVPRLAAAPGELADGGLQARVCGLGIGEGGRLVSLCQVSSNWRARRMAQVFLLMGGYPGGKGTRLQNFGAAVVVLRLPRSRYRWKAELGSF